MERIISRLVGQYESGRIGRRDLIAILSGLAVAGRSAPAAESPFRGVEINHVALRVTDIPRSKEFYQNLLGLPTMSESATSCFLRAGDNFLTLFKGSEPKLDHYCFGVQGYDVQKATATLRAAGLKVRQPVGTNRVYFNDPDGIEVQLAAPGHMSA